MYFPPTNNGALLIYCTVADFSLSHFADDKASAAAGYRVYSNQWVVNVLIIFQAPEIVLKQEFIDKRKVEVFVLGLILYRILVGKLPYDGEMEIFDVCNISFDCLKLILI